MSRGILAASLVMCCGLAASADVHSKTRQPGAELAPHETAAAVGPAWMTTHRTLGSAEAAPQADRTGRAARLRALSCPPGGTPEGEPLCGTNYIDVTNGGCNSVPAVFGTISPGETICGQTGTYSYNDPEWGWVNSRDTDWYEFTLTETSRVTLTGTGDAPLYFGILESDGTPGCGSMTGNLEVWATPWTGDTASVSIILPAGTWYAYISPQDFSGVSCGTRYNLTLEAEPYEVVIPDAVDLGEIAGELDFFSLGICGSGFDSEMGIWSEDGDLIFTDDNGCGFFAGPSQFYGLNLPQGKYYFSVSGWDTTFGNFYNAEVDPASASGTYSGLAADTPFSGSVASGEIDWYTFTIGEGGGCELECPPGAIVENEISCGDNYVDGTNGGCNFFPAAFSSMSVGDTVCGTAWTYITQDPVFGTLNARDIDWYQFTLTEDTAITLSGVAEFPLRLAIYDITGGCENGSLMIASSGLPCATVSAEIVLGPGTYAAWVGPDTFEGVACGSEYHLTLAGEPYDRPSLEEQSVGSFTLGQTVIGNNADNENLNDLTRLYPGVVNPNNLYASPGPDEVWAYSHPGGGVRFSIAADGPQFSDPSFTVWDADEQLMFGWRDFWYDQVWFAEGLPAGDYYVLVDTYTPPAAGQYALTAEAITPVATGDTTGAPRWHRPDWDFQGLSPDGTNVPYHALPIEVSETGAYDIFVGYSLTDGWDGFIFLYTEDFDPQAPLANTIAFNDDYLGTQTSWFENITLTAGEVYTLVITGWNNDQDGTYAVASRGPGVVSLVEPCAADHDGDGAKTVNDLLAYLGDFRNAAQSADMDGNGVINVNDLLAFLGAFRAGC